MNSSLYCIAARSVKGLHLNMFNVPFGGLAMFLSLLLGSYLPSLVGFSKEDVKRLYPVEKNLHALLRETGYLHIQATKPDTAGQPQAQGLHVSFCPPNWTSPLWNCESCWIIMLQESVMFKKGPRFCLNWADPIASALKLRISSLDISISDHSFLLPRFSLQGVDLMTLLWV